MDMSIYEDREITINNIFTHEISTVSIHNQHTFEVQDDGHIDEYKREYPVKYIVGTVFIDEDSDIEEFYYSTDKDTLTIDQDKYKFNRIAFQWIADSQFNLIAVKHNIVHGQLNKALVESIKEEIKIIKDYAFDLSIDIIGDLIRKNKATYTESMYISFKTSQSLDYINLTAYDENNTKDNINRYIWIRPDMEHILSTLMKHI